MARKSARFAPTAAKQASSRSDHRQDGWPRVEAVALELEQPGPAARSCVPFQDEHVVAGAAQVARGREPAEAGADDDDLGHYFSRQAT